MERVALDTGVLIAGLRHGIAGLTGANDIAIPAVAVAEFLVGCKLDTDTARAAESRDYLNALLAVAPILEYDHVVAEEHATLITHTRQAGRPRGAHDLIIAATATATGRAVATTDDRAAFDTLPDVECILVHPSGTPNQ